MREYFKILSSILVALLTLAVLVSVISVISALALGNADTADYVLWPFLIAWAGFILVGIMGSIFWLLFHKALGGASVSPMSRHAISAYLAAVSSWLILGVAISPTPFKDPVFFAIFLVPEAIVVAFSLLWYWVFFFIETNLASRLNWDNST